MKEDIPNEFWREYESLDMLEKEKKIKHIVKRIDELHGLKDDKLRKHALSTALQGYFDDLIDYMERRENDKNQPNLGDNKQGLRMKEEKFNCKKCGIEIDGHNQYCLLKQQWTN